MEDNFITEIERCHNKINDLQIELKNVKKENSNLLKENNELILKNAHILLLIEKIYNNLQKEN